jgi:hypothetical protein
LWRAVSGKEIDSAPPASFLGQRTCCHQAHVVFSLLSLLTRDLRLAKQTDRILGPRPDSHAEEKLHTIGCCARDRRFSANRR